MIVERILYIVSFQSKLYEKNMPVCKPSVLRANKAGEIV